jgi:hypothetical protein
MRRHSTDLVGLLFGLAFTAAGIGFLLHETTGTAVDPVWSSGLGLILLGVVALVATLARAGRQAATAPAANPTGTTDTTDAHAVSDAVDRDEPSEASVSPDGPIG